MTLGLPTFIVGSVALGLALVGVVPAGVLGAPLSIILAATGAGLTLAAIWAAAIGQSAVAAVFGIFAGFWLSYAGLVLGLLHNWFAIPATAVQGTVELFLATWLILIVMLTVATLRLPLAFTAVFTLIDVALALLLIGTAQTPTSTGLYKTAGVFVLAFAAVGMYVFFSSASVATGGKPLPLGRPIMH
jgi:succinate-acetate transporter protein